MSQSALGIYSSAGAAVVATGTYEHISTILVGTAVASIDFTGLSSFSADYKHLQIRFVAKNSGSGANTNLLLARFNGVSSGYSRHALIGPSGGGAATSSGTASQTSISISSGMAGSTFANTFAPGIIDITEAYSTTKNKVLRSYSGIDSSPQSISINSGMYESTTAISSVQLLANLNNIAVGSRFSIYGIRG